MIRDDTPEPVCPKCLSSHVPGEHFCRDCGAPIRAQATTNPFESIAAEAIAYREASDQPDKPIVLIGMWLIWAPQIFACIAIAAFFIYMASEIPLGDGATLVGFIAALVMFGFWA